MYKQKYLLQSSVTLFTDVERIYNSSFWGAICISRIFPIKRGIFFGLYSIINMKGRSTINCSGSLKCAIRRSLI